MRSTEDFLAAGQKLQNLDIQYAHFQPCGYRDMDSINNKTYPIYLYGFRFSISNTGSYNAKISETGTYKIDYQKYKGLRAYKPLKDGSYSRQDVPITSANLVLFKTKQDAEQYLEYTQKRLTLLQENAQLTFNEDIEYLNQIVLP